MTQDQGLVFEKIERHVDFTVDYTNAMQSTLFAKNRTLLQGFSNGIGGGAIRRMYEKFKQEALA